MYLFCGMQASLVFVSSFLVALCWFFIGAGMLHMHVVLSFDVAQLALNLV